MEKNPNKLETGEDLQNEFTFPHIDEETMPPDAIIMTEENRDNWRKLTGTVHQTRDKNGETVLYMIPRRNMREAIFDSALSFVAEAVAETKEISIKEAKQLIIMSVKEPNRRDEIRRCLGFKGLQTAYETLVNIYEESR